MKYLLSVLLIVFALPLFAQMDSVHVVLDPEGHTALVKSLMFSDTGEELISVSDDKTLKVWDTRSGRLIKSIRGQIGEGVYGMLNSGAIHPKSVVAVGGMIGDPTGRTGVYGIRLINIYQEKVFHEFYGPTEPIVSLSFSPDEKYLAAGSLDKSIGIFSMEGGDAVRLSGSDDAVYGLDFSPDSKKLVSASYDGKLRLWDIQKIEGQKEDYVKEMTGHEDAVRCVDFSPTGEYIISGGHDGRLLLWDGDGNFIKEIVKLTDPTYGESYGFGDIHTVSFTADGSKVVIGTSLYTGENAHVYEIPSGNRLSSIYAHSNTVVASATFGDDLVATAGGENRDIIIWDPSTGKIKHHITSHGTRVYAIGASEDGRIAFGQSKGEVAYINQRGPIEKVFNPQTLNLESLKPSEEKEFRTVINDYDGISFDLSGRNITLSNGVSIEVPPGLGSPVCASFTPNGEIAVGTTYRVLVYDLDGSLNRLMDGHLAEVNALSPSHDGRYLYTGSADQTMMIWDLQNPGKRDMTKEEYWNSIRDSNGFTDESLQQVLDKNNINFDEAYINDNQPKVPPLATIFVSKNDDWILWTAKNYYATSQRGSKYVGFHVNHGEEKTASFYTFEQFDLVYNRPDLVLGELGVQNNSLIESYYGAYSKRLEKLGISEDDLQKEISAPTLDLTTPAEVVTEESIRLTFQGLAGSDANLESTYILVNDVPEYGKEGLPASIDGKGAAMIVNTTTLILSPGRNKIQVYLEDEKGITSNRETVYVTYQPEGSLKKPDLYLYAIGVSEYKDKAMNLKYASKDARDLASMFGSVENEYGQMNIITITDKEVTSERLAAIHDDLKESEKNDEVVIFIAGHGLLDQNYDYYLATYDMDFREPSKRGIKYEELEGLLDGIPARKKLLLIDACHSGEVDKSEIEEVKASSFESGSVMFRSFGEKTVAQKTVGLQNSFELMKNRFTDLRKSSGATIISSAGGVEYAMEGSEWNNGVFTYAILQGLKSRSADLDKDGSIMISELQEYVNNRVVELTDGKQNPTSRRENLENDFRIWK